MPKPLASNRSFALSGFFRKLWLFSFLLIPGLFHLPLLPAAEFFAGELRLSLDEKTGRFSLYSVAGGMENPGALFAAEDPRTSFLSVLADDRSYKMGDSSAFSVRLGGDSARPSLIFESPFLRVTEEFTFISPPDTAEANGIAVTITLENRGDREIKAGARVLLDTVLCEEAPDISFNTNLRSLSSEALITGQDGDSFWTDKNGELSLTGSLFSGAAGEPDSVHFANWKKLHNVTWKAPVQRGKDFNAPPYSIGDTGVCYYYEPRPLGRDAKRSFGFALALRAESILRYAGAAAGAVPKVSAGEIIPDASSAPAADAALAARERDLAELRELIARIDAHIAAGTASEEELSAMESALTEFRAKYGAGAD